MGRRKKKQELQDKMKTDPEAQAAAEESIRRFQGIISKVFDEYLKQIYVSQAKRETTNFINKILESEPWIVDEEDPAKLIRSGTDLMRFIQDNIVEFSKLCRNSPLLDLAEVYKSAINTFITEKFNEHLPTAEEGLKMSENQEKTTCLILNTCEFCLQ